MPLIEHASVRFVYGHAVKFRESRLSPTTFRKRYADDFRSAGLPSDLPDKVPTKNLVFAKSGQSTPDRAFRYGVVGYAVPSDTIVSNRDVDDGAICTFHTNAPWGYAEVNADALAAEAERVEALYNGQLWFYLEDRYKLDLELPRLYMVITADPTPKALRSCSRDEAFPTYSIGE